MMVVKIKKQKARKSVIKRKLKFENYKHCIEATKPENKINHLEKNEINIDSWIVVKEIIRNDKKQ